MRRGSGSGAFKVVRTYDPALDPDAIPQERWIQFIQERDVALLDGAVFPGEKTTVFHCRPLSQAERRDVRGRAEADRHERAFALCVTRVEHLADEHGGHSTWVRPSEGAKPRPLGDRELEVFSEDDIQHVGQVIVAASFCAPDRPLYVPLLATCRDAMTAAALASQRRRAARTTGSSSSPDASAAAREPAPESR
ncbi:hypothetical protein [Sandaracinus amylolyticus]|uniref:Uncharacterized protein n=1 Tax=Sandaracinus amylolyticus TaxID=927083 RepID=A0A0F6SGL2_9BACT|nr:hypothetical protein [Sandaracinus amylolyticus]AKF08889.1 hypothetical protein DB32_006038 [Sandaracinus amylolyticus]